MSLTLRPATFTDAEAIHALIVEVYDRIFISPDQDGAQVFLASIKPPSLAICISAANFDYRVIEEGGAIVAAAAMRDGRHVYHMWVKASHQGRGLARTLWEALAQSARDQGNPGEFTVNASIDAIPVYAAFGFAPEGELQHTGGLAFQPMAIRLG